MESSERITRKQKRLLKNKSNIEQIKSSFELKTINPLTENQKLVFNYYDKGYNLLLTGSAGTGKTFMSLYLSLREIMNNPLGNQKIVLVRSVVPTRDMGFLPGTSKDKSKVYELPYYAICTELFGRGDAYDILKQKQMIEFITTSFIRGVTLNNCIVIVDEIQNLNLHELDSVITRAGNNCKIIFSGDIRQSDFEKENDRNGLSKFSRILKNMKVFKNVEFGSEDIVRSGLVKSYIIEKDKLGINA